MKWVVGVDEIEGTDGEFPLTRDELRQLEARIDARFQAVNARFIAVDGRFAVLGDRVGEIEQLARTMKSYEKRFRDLDNRFDATRTQIDHVRLQLSSQIDGARADLGRIVLLGLLGTTVCAAGLCLGTIILLL